MNGPNNTPEPLTSAQEGPSLNTAREALERLQGLPKDQIGVLAQIIRISDYFERMNDCGIVPEEISAEEWAELNVRFLALRKKLALKKVEELKTEEEKLNSTDMEFLRELAGALDQHDARQKGPLPHMHREVSNLAGDLTASMERIRAAALNPNPNPTI